MHPPIFVRELSDPERAQLQASLRAPSAFTLRRAQILLASAAGHRPREIARGLRCAPQTVRNAIHAFNATGLAALSAWSSRPKSAVPVKLGAHTPNVNRDEFRREIESKMREAHQREHAGLRDHIDKTKKS